MRMVHKGPSVLINNENDVSFERKIMSALECNDFVN